MKKFTYVVQDAMGKHFKGSLTAESRDKAVLSLQEKGFIILEVKEAGGIKGFSPKQGAKTTGSVSSHVLAFFAEQLSTLITGGVPLVRAISLLGEYSADKNMRIIMAQVSRDISSGLSLHSALSKHPKAFNHIWLSLVQAGELGGQLAETLMQIAQYVKTQNIVRSKIITALTYPAILFVMSMGVLVYFIVGIVPTFAEIFKDFNMELPPITQAVLAVSDLIINKFWFLLISVIAVIVGFRMWVRTAAGKKTFHSFLLQLPLLGPFIRNIYYERLLSTMSTLLKSGVTILNVITVVEESFDSNVIIQNALKKAKREVSEGKSISDAFRDTNTFPGLMTEMMRMGEESGRLPSIIETLSKFYMDNINQFIARFGAVIEPVLVVGVGAIIGVVVMSIFMPIFKISQMGGNI